MKTKYSNMWNLFSSIIFVPLNLLIISLSNNVKSFPMNDSQNIKSNTTVQTTISYRLDTWSQYDNPEEGTHHEGDIKISNTRKTITAFKEKLWPNGIVYYTLDELIACSITENNPQALSVLQEAMMIIMERTCIKFQRIYPDSNGQYSVESWVNIIGNKRGCYSDIGRNPLSGSSFLNLNINTCFDILGHALHEMLHTLGAYHEHMRSDRDEHINILWENIREGAQFNFKLLDVNTVNYYGLPYDYSSIMHYSMTAFSKNRSVATIAPKINNVEIGQRLRLSYYDIKKILITYKCSLMYYDKNEKLYEEENNGIAFGSSKLNNNTIEVLRKTTDNTVGTNKKEGIFINSTSTSEHESLNKTGNVNSSTNHSQSEYQLNSTEYYSINPNFAIVNYPIYNIYYFE
ncbi:hypothetical protein M0804_009630 [Polistes exclamans]|nr:hypothetical protein M0804_009630 [Polistes exclamans]